MKPIIIEKLNENIYFVDTRELSSNIKYIMYNKKHYALTLVFKSNDLYMYDYLNVEMSMFVDMLASDSLGKYFCREIKPIYKFKKWNRLTQRFENVGE